MSGIDITTAMIIVFNTAPFIQELFFVGMMLILFFRVSAATPVKVLLCGFLPLIISFLLSLIAGVQIHDVVTKLTWLVIIAGIILTIINPD